ncbi:MAG: class I SAM-dependent methyltransferase [Caulobacterales bacterium]
MTDEALLFGMYGAPPGELGNPSAHARQLSPLVPGSVDLGSADPGSFSAITLLAPAGTLERRFAMAQALLALAAGGALTTIAPKDKGGARMRKELEAFGCAVEETSKRHHRLCVVRRPKALTGVDDALALGGPQVVEAIGLWSQPGVFSWDRVDPGSALLASRLPAFTGHGADLGCGIGFLSLHVLNSPAVERLDLIDIDRRAIDAAGRNVVDPRVHLVWGDARSGDGPAKALDFVVMNPPFHMAATEDKALGQAFIAGAARRLRPGGACWLVANRHLPYEAALTAAFKSVRLDHEANGYKVFEARA